MNAPIEQLTGEYATTAAFGRRWLSHTVVNSIQMNEDSQKREWQSLIESPPTCVVAAGPSLERWEGSEISRAIAVDTAYPALLARGLDPPYIISLDPQGWSNLHLRDARHTRALIIATLGSPVGVTRAGERILYLSTNHPLHTLLRTAGFPLPAPFHGAIGVTEAAVELASTLGCPSIRVVGADGGYPAGQTYARGTYRYTFDQIRQTRIIPAEHRCAQTVYPNARIDRKRSKEHPFFSTPTLLYDQNRIETIQRHRAPRPAQERRSRILPSGASSARIFWQHHLEKLRTLRVRHIAHGATPQILLQLGPHGRAQLPLLSRITRDTPSLPLAERLAATIQLACEIIERAGSEKI